MPSRNTGKTPPKSITTVLISSPFCIMQKRRTRRMSQTKSNTICTDQRISVYTHAESYPDTCRKDKKQEVHSYVYAYVFIWFNQLCHSIFSFIPLLRHGNVQRRPFHSTQEKGMEKRPASLRYDIPVLLPGLPPLKQTEVKQ